MMPGMTDTRAHPSLPPSLLSPNFTSARVAFMGTAIASGGAIEHIRHPLTGPSGETLGIDIAEFGPPDAESMLMIVSGTHGVEGYCGSALQTHWLDGQLSTRPPGVRMVFLHALNPHGFAWVRRVNEDNVDLNRNFIDWSQPPPANAGYDEIAELLVPESWSTEEQQRTTGALLERAAATGMDQFQADVSRGQYGNPTGVFYGGSGPTWSHDRLREICAARVGQATRVGIIDLHTGLGEWGHGELIGHHATSHPAHQRAVSWWGDVRSMIDGDSVSASLDGDWLARAEEWFGDIEVTAAALEYGTVDTLSVLQSLRADAWLHAHGDPTSDEATAFRAQVRAAFLDDDPTWLVPVWARFVEVVRDAFDALS